MTSRLAPLVEWAVWMALALAAWLQTARFAEPIAEYRYGADGWVKAICIAIAVGATGQMLLAVSRGRSIAGAAAAESAQAGWGRRLQRLGIFVLPLVYLWLMPTMGFYLLTPAFILGMLLLMEVRSPLTLVLVTVIAYGLVLAVFTRWFYVALPTGSAEPFYGWNTEIIRLARWKG